MLNFRNNPYKTLQPAADGGGAAWNRAQGDVEMDAIGGGGGPSAAAAAGGGGGAPVVAAAAPTGGGMGSDSGRVQMPIGMVNNTQHMRSSQSLALGLFTAVNVGVLLVLFVLTLLLDGWVRVALVLVGGGGWMALLLYNVRMAGRPRRVLQTFLQTKPKTKLGRRLARGQTVVVRGAVSLLSEELLSTEFHSVPGLVLVESSLRSYHAGARKADAWTEHVRQTRAVDFRLTDPQTGMSAIVKAFNAAEQGQATPLVHVSTEVPLSTATPVAAPVADSGTGAPVAPGAMPKPVDTEERRRRRAAAAPQLMVCKGYIRQGQVVTVMGVMNEDPTTHELLIEPLPVPHNVAKLLFFRGFIPFFFPTWANGLIISDQRDLV